MGKHSKPRATGPGGEFDDLYEESAARAAGKPQPKIQYRVDDYTSSRREDAANARQAAATEPSTGSESNTVIGRFLGRKK